MPRTWPTREQWAADAEQHTRTICFAHERVSADPADWLSADELADLHETRDLLVRVTRRAMRRRAHEPGIRSDRAVLNGGNRRARRDRAPVSDVLFGLADVERVAAKYLYPEQSALVRLVELVNALRTRRDRAAAAAEEEAVRVEVARRNSEEGWQAELERRRRIETYNPLIHR